MRILNESKQLPFLPSETVLANEEMRLKYRYIDLRRDAMQCNIELRHKVALAIRDNLAAQGFFEIETPFMTRSTPEGARDYLVPSRVQPGMFYALPQSPQLFKQILMISGFDRYFQIVRCFRDEDLRADRQPEFTQIDLEMSYPQPEQVWEVVEGFLTAAFKAAGHEIKTPFPQMDLRPGHSPLRHRQARPAPAGHDRRAAMPFTCRIWKRSPSIRTCRSLPFASRTSASSRAKSATTSSRCLRERRSPAYSKTSSASKKPSRGGRAKFARRSCKAAAARLDRARGGPSAVPRMPEAGISQASASNAARRRSTPRPGRFALRWRKSMPTVTGFRESDFRFLWVTDFPMFEWDEDEKRWTAAHHPFTSPHEEDMDKLESDPAMVRALAYDVVLNGTELGSGSIRIHRQDVQSKIFHALGMTEEEARRASDFSWKRSNTALLRTAASR